MSLGGEEYAEAMPVHSAKRPGPAASGGRPAAGRSDGRVRQRVAAQGLGAGHCWTGATQCTDCAGRRQYPARSFPGRPRPGQRIPGRRASARLAPGGLGRPGNDRRQVVRRRPGTVHGVPARNHPGDRAGPRAARRGDPAFRGRD